jgi:hypothetical protein
VQIDILQETEMLRGEVAEGRAKIMEEVDRQRLGRQENLRILKNEF